MKDIEFDESELKLIAEATAECTDEFDVAIPQRPIDEHSTIVPISKKRPPLKLTSSNQYHQIIFSSINQAAKSNWYACMTSKTRRTYQYYTTCFVDWINDKDQGRTSSNRYQCLDDFAAFRIRECEVKHSGVMHIKTLIKQGLEESSLGDEDQYFLRHLLKISKKTRMPEKESYTLTEWFNIPWIREIIGEKKYLQLESPARLLLSFRVSIAVTLLYILEARDQWKKRVPHFPTPRDDPRWWAFSNPHILNKFGEFTTEGNPTDALTHLLWIDYVIPKKSGDLKEKIKSSDNFIFPTAFKFWQQPVVFKQTFPELYSSVEQRLASWLAACDAVQPQDIPKLKTSNYAMEFNGNGRLLMLQCMYYKGRSGNYKHTQTMTGSDIWTQALYRYINALQPGEQLFTTNVLSALTIPSLGEKAKVNTEFKFLFHLWKSPELRSRLDKALSQAHASNLFIDAILAFENGGESFGTARLKISEYLKHIEKPLPPFLFKLSHIKTTAVHANSDAYRDSDLINHHSHTSETEKHNYLTDANKDWVNQCGRITRLVLHDLQNVVYQPSVSRVKTAVNDAEIRTKLIQAAGSDDVQISNAKQNFLNEVFDDQEIIVVDTIDTALFFIHYLEQAESALPRLLSIRPDFVQRTLLVHIEWMTRTLQRMQSAKKAKKQYAIYKDHLPPMFDYLFETME